MINGQAKVYVSKTRHILFSLTFPLCHVERSRDISESKSRDSSTSFFSARNDKNEQEKRFPALYQPFYGAAVIARYSRPEMRAIWSDQRKFEIWLRSKPSPATRWRGSV